MFMSGSKLKKKEKLPFSSSFSNPKSNPIVNQKTLKD